MKSYKVEYFDTFFKRFKGLMLRKNILEGYIYILFPCNQVHSLFMLREISLIVLDRDKIVIAMVETLKPWKVSSLFKNAYYILETVDWEIFSSFSIGDKVEI